MCFVMAAFCFRVGVPIYTMLNRERKFSCAWICLNGDSKLSISLPPLVWSAYL